jgi:conjugal transfer pilus assembly protein TraV
MSMKPRLKKYAWLIVAVCLVALLQACSTSPTFECGAPMGVGCVDMDKIDSMVKDETLPTLKQTHFKGGTDDGMEAYRKAALDMEPTSRASPQGSMETIEAGEPLYVAPEIMRTLVREFSDTDGDLHGESFIFIKLHPGYWRVGKDGKL